MPQWFAATYHDADGDPDLEAFWADVGPESFARHAVTYQLRNAFGGYCENLPSAALWSGAVTRNPWRDGGCVPAAPGGLTATAVGSGKLNVVWDPPAHDGGSPIEGYQVQWKSGSQDYDSSGRAATIGPEAWLHTIDGLTNGIEYAVRMVAYNQNGDGAAAEATGTPVAAETIAPELSMATVTGATLVLTYDEALDEASQPGASAFAVQAGVASREVAQVVVSGNAVTLTLASAVISSDEVTVHYVVPEGPGAKPIRDVTGNNAAPLFGRTVRNDTIAEVISIAITSDPGPDRTYTAMLGTWGEPEVIEVTLTFSERVTVTGAPVLPLDAGKPPADADSFLGAITFQSPYSPAGYHGGSGTATLTFRYTASEGDHKPDGVSVPARRWSPQLYGGTIKDGANKNAVLTHSGLAAQPGHKVDGVRPAPIAGGAVANGTTLTLTFDEPLAEDSVPTPGYGFSVTGRTVTGIWVDGAVVTLALNVPVSPGDEVYVRYTVPYYRFSDAIRDAVGNLAGNFYDHAVTVLTDDTMAPRATRVDLLGASGHSLTYIIGESFDVTVTFNESVTVDATNGSPSLGLNVGHVVKQAVYHSGTGTAVLTFRYTVEENDEDTDGVEPGDMVADGATIRDGSGNDAVLTLPEQGTRRPIKVDGVRPTLTATNGATAAGAGHHLLLNWSERLHGSSEPAAGAFTLAGGAVSRSVTSVQKVGLSQLKLIITPPIEHGETGITLAYAVPTGPDASPIRDRYGNAAAAFSGQAVADIEQPALLPRNLVVAPVDGREGVLQVSWDAPLDDGGSAITAYRVYWRSEYSGISSGATVTDLANLTYTITGLFDGIPYRVRVRAINGVGGGAWSSRIATPGDRVRPELSAAVVAGGTLTLTWSEALDESSEPAADAFAVSVAGVARGVTEVSVAGSTVALTLASAVAADDVVTVSYSVPAAPAAPRIEDTAGNDAAAFSGAAVTNNTSDSVNTPPTGLPTISGAAHVGETLTASVSEIADEDGIGGATFTYQWIRSDGTTDTDIAAATQVSYTLVAADQGKTIKVRATFIDDGGTEEALTSAATAVVQGSLTLSVSDGSATEGAAVEFTVSLSAASSQQVTVQYATSGGTAESGTDFTAASGTLTFAANETSQTVSVSTTADSVYEENETFTLALSNPTNATLGDAAATGTIIDDDSPAWNPTFSLGYTMLHPRLWDAPNLSMEDKERWASFWPIRGQQFEPAGLAAGEKVNFRVEKAYAAQDIGSVRLELTGAHSASRTDNTAPYTLFDDPAGLALPVGSYQISATAYPEPDLGGTPGTTRTATFTLATDTTAPSVRVLCGDDVPTSRSFEVTVVFNEWVLGFAVSDIAVADANGAQLAHSGSGHGPVNASLWHYSVNLQTDVSGEITVTVPAGVARDEVGNLNTASEPLRIALNRALSVADASAVEGTDETIEFEVTLDAASDCQAATVDWVTADGTATAGEDYTAANGTLTFGPGETSKTVSVVILDDTVEDSGETLTLQLSNASGVTLADAEATGTISDEESPFVSMPQIDGVPQVGNTLEVSFAEPPSGALAYQWLRGSEVIAGATASTHVPTVADVGARLSVRVERGGETRTSAPTAPVWPGPANPPLADGEEELLSATVTLGSHQFPYWVAGYGRVLGESLGEMDVTSFEDGGATYVIDAFLVNSRGVFALATGSTLPDASGLVAYWNGYRISGLETEQAKRGTLPMLAGRTPQPSTEYARYEDGASDGVRVAVSLRRVTNNISDSVNTPPTGLPAVSGTARVGEMLTASETGIADVDGLSGATFAWQWIANDGSADAEIAGATGATCTLTAAELGKTVKVQVTFTDDGGTAETLVSAATGQVSAALTARFENVPERHDGATAFAVRIAFSEAVTTGVAALGDHAAEVTDGSVTGARRIDGRSDLWELSVEPASDAEVTLALPADRACDAAGALCTADGGRLSNRPEATIAGPLPAISIAASASPVAEGTAAAFTLSRSGDTAAALTVAVVVAEDGAALMGAPPANVTFAAGAGTAELAVATDDDETAESASTVIATLKGGAGYAVDAAAASASVTVADDDAAPVVTTATPISAPENGTTVATLVATDTDTPAADLAWSIAGGADADKFTLTAAGVLAFKAAPDFEAPDDAGADGEYEVTVAVTDGANPVAAELTVRLTDVDDVAPVLTGASVDGATVTLTFDEALDESSVPPAGAFAVTVGTASRGVSSVSVDGSATVLTLASAVTADDTVALTYAVPAEGSARIRDTAGNAAAGFSRQPVTNATPVANRLPTGQPAIAGTPLVGATLTASAHGIEDADGLAGAVFAWQWIVSDGTGDADIAGATEASYTLTAAAAGKTVKVRVTFTDDGGTEETLLSAATATVSAPLPEVSIAAAASPVTEGNAAVFVLRRSGATTSALTVTVSVTEAGDVLDGAAPSSVTFAENAAEARLRIATEDDAAAEADARVTATVAAGAGYRVAAAAAAAGVDVFRRRAGAVIGSRDAVVG